ncbi:MAG: restriction endonuclease subunit S [Rubrivivax sp.]|nr:restriction endonuclease subunit S [Rubrivivax sp.]
MIWTTHKLSAIAELTLGKMLDQKKNKGEPRPYLANVNVRWGSFDLSDLREMRFEPHEAERYGLRVGDIVMCEGGEPGRCALWKGDVPGTMLQKALHRVRARQGVDARFLFYSLFAKGRAGELEYLFTGATIKHLPSEQLAKVTVQLPPPGEQLRIASILGAYDDLIEVNRRRIAVLEEMARRLFEEWFVRVAAGTATDDGEGPLPTGWSMQRLGELIQLDKGVSYSGDGLTPDGDPLVNLKNILAGGGFRTDGLKWYSGEVKARHCVVPGDLVMANTDLTPSGGVIGNAALVPMIDRAGRIAITHHLFAVRPLGGSPVGRHYLCQWLNSPRFKSYARGHANGATVLGLRADSVLAHRTLVPPPALAKRFEDFASSSYVLAQNLVRANQQLAASRDLLLPRLISGDLPATAAERELEAAA